MHQAITNPLYKDYNSKGYVKSEDELGRELIVEFTRKFNSWLESLQGDKVEVDPEVLIRILRTELEVPEPSELKNIEKYVYYHNFGKKNPANNKA